MPRRRRSILPRPSWLKTGEFLPARYDDGELVWLRATADLADLAGVQPAFSGPFITPDDPDFPSSRPVAFTLDLRPMFNGFPAPEDN